MIESKRPSIVGLATNSVLNSVENETPDVSNLVKKADYDAEISGIENNYIATADYNKFTKGIVDNSIKSKSLVDKPDIARLIINAELDKEVATLGKISQIRSRTRQNN